MTPSAKSRPGGEQRKAGLDGGPVHDDVPRIGQNRDGADDVGLRQASTTLQNPYEPAQTGKRDGDQRGILLAAFACVLSSPNTARSRTMVSTEIFIGTGPALRGDLIHLLDG